MGSVSNSTDSHIELTATHINLISLPDGGKELMDWILEIRSKLNILIQDFNDRYDIE